MLTCYADENVQAAVVAGLRRNGMDVVTAHDRGQRNTDDEILLGTATSEGRLLLTNDTDFLRIHSEWLALGRPHAGIVYWPQKKLVGEVIRKLIAYAHATASDDAASTVRFL